MSKHASHSQKPTEDTNTSQRQMKKRQWNKKRLRQRKNRETFFPHYWLDMFMTPGMQSVHNKHDNDNNNNEIMLKIQTETCKHIQDKHV